MRCSVIALVVASMSAVAQFQMQDSTTTASLRGISSPGNGVAWASGSDGTILRTEDGGFVWQGCSTPPGAEKLDFRGIQAFNAQTALVMSSGKGDLSRVFKTTDGCRTWKLVFTNPDAEGFFDAISMDAPQQDPLGHPSTFTLSHGQLLGDPIGGVFAVFETADGGDTWIRQVARSRQDAGCRSDVFRAHSGQSAFAASNQALISIPGGPRFAFVTGGSIATFAYVDHFDLDFAFCHDSAKQIRLPLAQGSSSSGAFAVGLKKPGALSDPFDLVIVGGDYQHPEASAGSAANVLSRNGFSLPGMPWFTVKKSNTPPHGYRSSVAYDAPSHTWITTGPNGTDISRDDGRNWSPLRPGKDDQPDADKQWNALALPFVVGPHGRIGRLRDGVLIPTPATPPPAR